MMNALKHEEKTNLSQGSLSTFLMFLVEKKQIFEFFDSSYYFPPIFHMGKENI